MDFTVPSSPLPGAVFPEQFDATSMSYHEDGKHLYVAYERGALLQIIDCVNGSLSRPSLKCERERIHDVAATHQPECVLISGKGSPAEPASVRNAISYWSLHDNKILRKFRGHTDLVNSISMCPANDTFLTTSNDRTVRLWSLDKAGCVASVQLPDLCKGNPLATFDSSGLVFAIAAAKENGKDYLLNLYDARNFSGGSFSDLEVTHDALSSNAQTHASNAALANGDWKSLSFNKAGSRIVVGNDMGATFLLDGYEGTVLRTFVGAVNQPAVSCITGDDRSLLVAEGDGSISCWELESGVMKKRVEAHPESIRCLAANPKHAQFASAAKETALWVF